ncbi:MAG: hypothetical protein BWK78_02325 [Thiotrichaceae bacterium IS1]|nr:MAG: hypothetical protein BWK78_02325 [Thiotrichaceae bacterium IS1]
MILAGDIGAQQSWLALYEHDKDAKGKIHLGKPKTERSFSHTGYSNLKGVFADFFAQAEVEQVKTGIYAVCLSIAGPITGKCFNLHGAPWAATEREFCRDTLTKFLFCPVPILFLNDMEALGYSIFTLPQEELATLDMVSLNETTPAESAEEDKHPRCALMLVVEGLGQALWSWDEKSGKYSPSSSEGGHTDFAARNEEEIKLLQYLQSKSQGPKRPPISYEQVLSVGGLLKILAFVEETSKQPLSSTFKQNLEKQPVDKKIELLAEAAIKNDVVCKKTWDLFLSILGAQAGNIALTYRAEGGIYLTGFVLVELVKQLRQKQVAMDIFFAPLLNAFSHKEGVFANLNAKTPVNIVCKSGLAMAGAAQHALPFVTKGFFEVNRELAK